jgi:hypothetical protein
MNEDRIRDEEVIYKIGKVQWSTGSRLEQAKMPQLWIRLPLG